MLLLHLYAKAALLLVIYLFVWNLVGITLLICV